MKTHTLQKTLPLNDSYDVLVAGGGPAGCAAATAAAREGAKTLLIEATGSLGGMATNGLVTCWCPFSDGKKILYRGLAERVFTQCKAGMPHIAADALDWVALDPELLKRLYDDLVTGAGADIRFHTFAGAVECDDDGRVRTLIAANKDGLTAFSAKIFVDCTGDADLAAWAGAECHKGEPGSGELQPASHCFILANVDEYARANSRNPWGPDAESPIQHVVRSEKYPRVRDTHLASTPIGPGVVGFNAGHLWDVDGTDPASVSAALIEGRKLAAELRDGLAEFHPAYANAFLVTTGPLMGIRETRRIVGDYTLTLDDYLARRSFPDEICRNAYPIDVHTAKSEIAKNVAGELDVMARYENYAPGDSHGVPYRCLTPATLRNVLVAGRSISCDRPVQGSIRVMPPALALGEAAGLAAALAAATASLDVHTVDTQTLRARLKEEGAYLPDAPQTS